MSGNLLSISRVAMLTFLLSSMLGVGLSLTLQQIITPLRNVRLVLAALVANFVVVPLLAVGSIKLFRLEQPFAIGLLLLGLAPGAPFLPKLAELVRGDLAFSVGLMVLLMAGTVVTMPIVLPLVLPGVKVGMWQIARPLLLLMVLPLIGALICKARWGSLSARVRPWLGRLSNLSLVILVVLIVAMNLPSVLRVFGTGAIGATLLFTVLAGLTGYLLSQSGIQIRKVMVLGTGFRNIAAALVVSEEDFRDPRVTVMLVIAALVGLLLLLPVALTWRASPLNTAAPGPGKGELFIRGRD